MRFTVNAGEFAKAMSKVRACVPARTTIPILSHVQIIASGGRVSVRGTSLDFEAMAACPASIEDEGSSTAPGAMLQSIASSMPKTKDVSFHFDGNILDVSSGRSRYRLATLPSDTFPGARPPRGDGAVTIRMAAADVERIIGATADSASTETTRYHICGIHMRSTKKGGVLAVATDGHELVKTTADATGGPLPDDGITIPTNAAMLIRGLALSTEGEIDLTTDGERICANIVGSDDTVTSSLIDGAFPDFNRAIPHDPPLFAEVTADEFLGAVSRSMAIYTGSNLDVNRLAFKSNGEGVSIESSGTGSTGAEFVSGETSEHAFAACGMKLKRLLSLWGDKPIKMHQLTAGGAILITSDRDDKTLQVLMPMK